MKTARVIVVFSLIFINFCLLNFTNLFSTHQVYSAATVSAVQTVAQSTSNGSTLSLPSWSPQANELILVAVSFRNKSIIPSVSGNNLNFVKIADIDNTQNEGGLALFRAQKSNPASGSIIISLPGNSQPAVALATRFNNVDASLTDGAAAVENFIANNGPAADNNDLKININSYSSDAFEFGTAFHRKQTLSNPPASNETAISLNNAAGSSNNMVRLSSWYERAAYPATVTLGKDNDLNSNGDWAIIAVSIKPATIIPTATYTPTVSPSITSSPTPTDTPSPTVTLIPTITLTPTPTQNPTTYLAYLSSSEDIANPERGFMKQSSIWLEQPFDTNKVKANNPTDTLVWIYFRLDNFRDPRDGVGVSLTDYQTVPLTQAALDNLQLYFATARSKGLKLVIRFIYNPGPGSSLDPNLVNPDAPLATIQTHIGQVMPIVNANSDVIAAMQVGFVGHWGEWHSTKYNADPVNRRAVIDALLNSLTSNRTLMLRYPRYKEMFYGGPLTAEEAFTGTQKARLAHHDDAFLKSENDDNTFKSNTAQPPTHSSTYCDGQDEVTCWKNYYHQDTRFLPVGGEASFDNPPRTSCPNTLDQMSYLHWSFINNVFNQTVHNRWITEGCMPEIRNRLGYRLELIDASVNPTVAAGQFVNISFRLKNTGFASIYNSRPAYISIIGANTRYDYLVPDQDPRRWEPGLEQTIGLASYIPEGTSPGTYKITLWMPDASPSIQNDTRYSIRFANQNTWDSLNGVNVLYDQLNILP